MAQPVISIVTPSFNQAAYLEQTMQSVLTQGCERLQYVVMDAASTDGSVEIIRTHEPQLHHWMSAPDDGYADAINKGFAETTGEVMGWLNSSDIHYPWTLKVVAEVFEAFPQVDWIMGMPTVLAEDGAVRSAYVHYSNRYDFLSGAWQIQQESTFWRRSLWDAAGGLDTTLRYAADVDLWARFFRRAALYHVSCPLGGYRVHDVRLGQRDGGYGDEVKTVLEREVTQAGDRDRRRAGLVRVSRALLGSASGAALRKSPVPKWYRHPRLIFDFDLSRWTLSG